MSTATYDPFALIRAVAMPDDYSVSAGQTLEIPENLGLLVNDTQVFNEQLERVPQIVAGVGPVKNFYMINSLVLNSDYGQWAVQANGALTYIANGPASKQLSQGQVAFDLVYYEEEYQPTTDSSVSKIGDVTMNITGIYDPLEASNGGPIDYRFSEDEWKDRINDGDRHFSIPQVHIDYVDDPADLQAVVNFDVRASSPEVQTLFSAELENFKAQIHPGFDWVSESSGIYFVPDFEITKADLDFLRPGDQITVEMKFTVSDGITSKDFISNIIIDGVDHPLTAVSDTAETTRGVGIELGASHSVLANDQDPDAQGTMQVVGIATDSGFEGGVESNFKSAYGSMTMLRDGTYTYVPDEFPNSLFYLHDVIDRFTYYITNQANETTSAALDITVKPYPGAVKIISNINQSVEVYENLQLVGTEASSQDDGLSSSTYLGEIVTHAVRDINLSFLIEPLPFSFVTSDNSAATRSLIEQSLSHISLEISASGEPVLAEGMWESQFGVTFKMDQSTSPRGFDFLNEGGLIKLDYVIHGDSGKSLPEQGHAFDVIYDPLVPITIYIIGQNDAPIAIEDTNYVSPGQTIHVQSQAQGKGLLDNDHDEDLGDVIHLGHIEGLHGADHVTADSSVEVRGGYGTLTVFYDGSYIYQADAMPSDAPSESEIEVEKKDVFYYAVRDSHDTYTDQVLTINILGPNDRPIASDDEMTILMDQWDPAKPLPNILANDADYDTSRLRVAWVEAPPDQYVLLDELGNISPDLSTLKSLKAGQSLDVSFSYTATNGVAESDITNVLLHIVGSDEAPVPENDAYFYENVAGSVFEVSQPDGLIFHKNLFDHKTDTDIDNDNLVVSAVSVDTKTWVNLTDGSATLQLDNNVSVLVHSNGSFVMDTPDDYRGMASFSYLLSDGIKAAAGSATVEVGGPAPQQGQLLINEISLDNPILVRNAYTDNGSAPNRIQVGKASIELLNDSTQAITAAQLAKMKIEIETTGADGNHVMSIDLAHLTGLTEDASGHALNKFFIPAGGVLMLYEPGPSGLGTWALYGPHKSFIIGGSGSYAGQDWPLGHTTKEAIAIDLSQNGTSIDLFAANGADTSVLTGVVGLGDKAHDEITAPGVPWAGTDVGTQAGVQYDGSMSGPTDTVFARDSLVDTNSEKDWMATDRSARTIGAINDRHDVAFSKDQERLEYYKSKNPGQGLPDSTGQEKLKVSGTTHGGSGPDVLIGSDTNDKLWGEAGNDWIDGGAGDDEIHGGPGVDILTGSSGEDVFVYDAVMDSTERDPEIILDFEEGQDKINLSWIDADAAKLGDQEFVWGGAVASWPQPGSAEDKVVYWTHSGDTFIQADAAGDQLPPLELALRGVHTLSAADFML